MNPVRNLKNKYCLKDIKLAKYDRKISNGVKIDTKQKSFTLVEILIYIGVLAIIILVVSTFFLWVTRSNHKATAIRGVSDNTRELWK